MTDRSEALDLSTLLVALVLSIARVYTFIRFSPIFTQVSFIGSVRYGVMFALAIIPAPLVYDALQTSSPETFFPLLARELIIGLLLAFFVWLPFYALEFSGAIIDTQKGVAMAEDFNPLTETTGTLTSELLTQIFTVYLFSSGLFLVSLNLLFISYEILPITETDLSVVLQGTEETLVAVGHLFYLSLAFAAPVVGALLISDIVITIVARFAPQVNALVFNLPIKAVIALVFYIAFVKVLLPEASSIFLEGSEVIAKTLRSLVQ